MMKFHSEQVNRPPHYAGDIECIDAMVQQFGAETVKTACVVQAFEMLWRWNKKGDPDENLQKAHWWLSFALGDDPRKQSAKDADKWRLGRTLNTVTGEETIIDGN
jgi:hypothetical protein